MEKEWSTVRNKTNLKTIAIIIIAIIAISGITGIALSTDLLDQTKIQLDKNTTSSYNSITAEEAKGLLNETINIIVVDIRGCDCNYKNGHIPTSIWQTYPPNLYDTGQDLLIYCQNGNESEAFCEELVGHTYAAIYYLEGGMDAWETAGYETIAVEE